MISHHRDSANQSIMWLLCLANCGNITVGLASPSPRLFLHYVCIIANNSVMFARRVRMGWVKGALEVAGVCVVLYSRQSRHLYVTTALHLKSQSSELSIINFTARREQTPPSLSVNTASARPTSLALGYTPSQSHPSPRTSHTCGASQDSGLTAQNSELRAQNSEVIILSAPVGRGPAPPPHDPPRDW